MTRKPLFSYTQLARQYSEELHTFTLGEGAFTRHRQIDLADVVGYILELCSSSQQFGLEIVARCYAAQMLGLNRAHCSSSARSSLCEARQKVSWEALAFLLGQVNADSTTSVRWRGHVVRAVDGTRVTLPVSKEILKRFPRSKGPRGHYPYGLLLTAANVFSGQFFTAELGPWDVSEREMLAGMLNQFSPGDISLLDRGFQSEGLWHEFNRLHQYFIARVCAGTQTQSRLVWKLLKSGRCSMFATIIDDNGGKMAVRLVLARKRDRKGRPIVLLTNLTHYSWKQIRDLYLERWTIETLYYRLKRLVKVENFHAKKINGVLQEIWGSLVILSLAGEFIYETCLRTKIDLKIKAPNFKNALEVIRTNLPLFVKIRMSAKRIKIKLRDLCHQIVAIICYKQRGRRNPRLSKQPCRAWNMSRGKGLNDRPRSLWDRKMRKLDPNHVV